MLNECPVMRSSLSPLARCGHHSRDDTHDLLQKPTIGLMGSSIEVYVSGPNMGDSQAFSCWGQLLGSSLLHQTFLDLTPVCIRRDVDGLWYAFLDYLRAPAGSDELAMRELERRLRAIKDHVSARGGGPYLQGTDISAQDLCLAPRLHHILTALPHLKVAAHPMHIVFALMR